MAHFHPHRSTFFACIFLLVCRLPALGEAPRVVLISVDGLRADMVTDERMPNLAALAADGFRATNALNDLPVSTVANHATMLTGVTSRRHGVLVDRLVPNPIPRDTILSHAARAGLRCAFFANKDKLDFLVRDGECDQVTFDSESTSLVAAFVEYVATRDPDFVFLHLRDPDSNGHRAGWLTDDYFAAVQKSDAQIAEVWALLAAETARESVLIITADHGGEGDSHIFNTPATRRIPWIAVGDGVRNVAFADSLGIADTMPTVLSLLEVAVPNDLDGRDLTRLLMNETPELPAAVVTPISLPCVILALPLPVLCGFILRKRTRVSEQRAR